MSKILSTRDIPGTSLDQLHRDLSTAVIGFHEAVARRLGMSAAERKVLGVLGEMAVTTPGQLAQATGLTTGAITGILDRLEKAEFAAREPHPTDRRSVVVRALRQDDHMAHVRPLFASLTLAMTAQQAAYTPAQLEIIKRYLAETTATLRLEAGKVEALPKPRGARKA